MPDPVPPPASDPVNNPNVRPAKWWEWTGWWSLLLMVAEWAQGELGLWKDPPKIVGMALVAIPFLIRFARTKTSGLPQSFRRLKQGEPLPPPG